MFNVILILYNEERTKLESLKSKLQNSSNSAEKERLQTEISKAEALYEMNY